MAKGPMSSSPTSTLMSPPVSPPSESPPMSPGAAAAVRRSSWPAVGAAERVGVSQLRRWGLTAVGFCSLPTTPTRAVGGGVRMEKVNAEGDAEAVERVESGRALRAKIFEKLSKETASATPAPAPDWAKMVRKEVRRISTHQFCYLRATLLSEKKCEFLRICVEVRKL